jgi:hypothetical protein
MAVNFKDFFKKRLKRFLKPGIQPGSSEIDVRIARRERVVVFFVAFLIALSMWFIVNLSGVFNVTLNIPLVAGDVPSDMALVEGLPEVVQVEVSGDGWKLANLYNKPPEVLIDIVEGEVNLFDQVRQRFTFEQDVSVLKVQPFIVNITLEPKISKTIPIRLNTTLSYQDRFGLVGNTTISPDSITITGARSQVEEFDEWIIPDTLVLENLRADISENIPILPIDPLIEFDVEEIEFTGNVSEFTEGEVMVFIRTRNLPRGSIINYNPSSVNIRFDVPIEQYVQVQNARPYEVYVPYQEILEDSTGFVTPDIEQVATQYQLKLRSFQPKAVAYFSVLEN